VLTHDILQDQLQQDRIKDTEAMVKDMTIVNQVSADLNQQTHAQQEGLDNISSDIENSKESIDTGNNHLVKVRASPVGAAPHRLLASSRVLRRRGLRRFAASRSSRLLNRQSLCSPWLSKVCLPNVMTDFRVVRWQAVEANKAHKQWMCCIAVMGVVGVGVVALIIYLMTQ